METSAAEIDKQVLKSLREADEYEHKLAKVYSANLDANLIFAGLLSAVSSAFIVGVQAQFLLQTGPDANPDSPWIDDYSFFLVQPYLFSSLIVSLLAAFAAVSGKQWVDRVHMRRSPIDRSRDGRLNGAKRPIWGLSFLIHSPPIMLQLALLLLGLALCTYLFTIDQTSAYILVIFFAVGLGPYCYMAYQAFNSAVSRPQIHWHLLITTVYLNEFLKESWWLLRRLFSQTRPNDGQGKADGDLESALQSNPMGPVPSPPSHSPVSSGEDTNHGENSADQSNKIYMVSVSDAPTNPPVSSGEDTDQERNSGGESTPPHPNIHAVPLKRLYKTLTENFCTLFGRTVVIPKLEEKAYFSAKALLYAAVQCKYKGNESDKAAFDYISSQYKDKGTWHFKTNSPDLLSTLGIMDHVFKPDGFEEIPWDALSLTYPHQAWMGQILLYRASCILNDGKPLPDDIRGFVLYSLRSDPPPPPPIVLDCLRIICLVLKMEPDPDDQQGMDKSEQIRLQIDHIYKKLTTRFENSNSTIAEINMALEALELITPLSENDVATKSYNLFRVVMHPPPGAVHLEDRKWEARRLALHGAYKQDKFLPLVGDPQDILAFLTYHFGLEARGKKQDEPIRDALRALGCVSNPVMK